MKVVNREGKEEEGEEKEKKRKKEEEKEVEDDSGVLTLQGGHFDDEFSLKSSSNFDQRIKRKGREEKK